MPCRSGITRPDIIIMEKEIKEITKTTDRWVRLKKGNVEIVISTPYETDTMESLTNKADELMAKHSERKGVPGYAN